MNKYDLVYAVYNNIPSSHTPPPKKPQVQEVEDFEEDDYCDPRLDGNCPSCHGNGCRDCLHPEVFAAEECEAREAFGRQVANDVMGAVIGYGLFKKMFGD